MKEDRSLTPVDQTEELQPLLTRDVDTVAASNTVEKDDSRLVWELSRNVWSHCILEYSNRTQQAVLCITSDKN